MLETDSGPFEMALKRLSGALQKKWKPDEWRTLVSVYFAALQHVELPDVVDTFTRLQARDRWPKIGDVIAALPIRATVNPFGARIMRTAEVDEYLEAKRRHYHGDPCGCLLCQEADALELPLRFVPDFTPDDLEDRAFCPALNRLVVSGHWAHGFELRRWYAARATFAASAPKPYRRVVLQLVPPLEREPGEDDV